MEVMGAGRFPTVFARRNASAALEVAQRFRVHLDSSTLSTTKASEFESDGGNVLILDRGSDLTSLLVHDLAFLVRKR